MKEIRDKVRAEKYGELKGIVEKLGVEEFEDKGEYKKSEFVDKSKSERSPSLRVNASKIGE